MSGDDYCVRCEENVAVLEGEGYCLNCLGEASTDVAPVTSSHVWASRPLEDTVAYEPTNGYTNGHGRSTLPPDSPTVSRHGDLTDIRLPVPVGNPDETDVLGQRFGRYLLIKLLGQGGMGVVYEAVQGDLNRPVALKRLAEGAFAQQKDRQRFRGEAMVIASLDHPNIVPIYEIGEQGGEYYFVMKLYKGQDLRKRLTDYKGKTREIAQLVITIARAIQYAHGRGILHRDLKPSNILLDENGVPQVIDFGLAVRIEDAINAAKLSKKESFEGTPEFMSPEQAAGRADAATTMTDVYGLGGILYALLTTRPPFKDESIYELRRKVMEDAPARPSRLDRAVDKDLEAICLKSLSKDPANRYTTAKEMADDLQNWLDGMPVDARPISLPVRTVKWARRRPGIASLWAALLTAIAAGIIGTVAEMFVAWENEKVARDNALVAVRNEQVAKAQEKKALERETVANKQRYAAEMGLGGRDYEHGNIAHLRQILASTMPGEGREDLRGFEWYYLRALTKQERVTLTGRSQVIRAIDYSPDGTRIVAVGDDDVAEIFDPSTGNVVRSIELDSSLTSVAYHPDGGRFVTGSVGGKVTLVEIATGQPIRQFDGMNTRVNCVAISADGARVAAGGQKGRLVVWDSRTGAILQELKGHDARSTISAVAFDAKKGWLASAAGIDFTLREGSEVRVWDVETGRLITTLDDFPFGACRVDFSADGSRLAVGAGPNVYMYGTAAWKRENGFRGELRGHLVDGFDLSADGTRLAVSGFDQIVRIWDVTGEPRVVREFRGHAQPVAALKFHPKGPLLASADEDGAVKVWGINDEFNGKHLPGYTQGILDVDFFPQGGRFATAGIDGVVRIYEKDAVLPFRQIDAHKGYVSELAISPDRERIVTVGSDHTIKIWDIETGRLLRSADLGEDESLCVAYSPDGKLIAFGKDKDIVLWDQKTHKFKTLRGHFAAVQSLAFTHKGDRIASAGSDGQVKIWDTANGDEVGPAVLKAGQGNLLFSVTFSPDDTRVVSGGRDNLVHIWDARTGETIHTLRGHHGFVGAVEFSPDGRRLVSAGADCVRLWDAELGRELIAFDVTETGTRAVAFSPDGHTIVSGGAGDRNPVTVRKAVTGD